jgi:RNA polymerase sigma-70 factor (ECF subfamily)
VEDHQQIFGDLVREHGALIARIAASYEADPELARDLTQEILLAVWRAVPTFREQSSWRTYIARIAHNRSVTHVARAAGRPISVEMPETLECPAPHPEAMALEGDRWRSVLNAVQQLPIAYRQVATLTLEGFSPADIAQILGLSANAVAIRSTRARALLRASLSEPS